MLRPPLSALRVLINYILETAGPSRESRAMPRPLPAGPESKPGDLTYTLLLLKTTTAIAERRETSGADA